MQLTRELKYFTFADADKPCKQLKKNAEKNRICLTHDCKPGEGLSDVTINMLPKHGFLNYGLQMTSNILLLVLWSQKKKYFSNWDQGGEKSKQCMKWKVLENKKHEKRKKKVVLDWFLKHLSLWLSALKYTQ